MSRTRLMLTVAAAALLGAAGFVLGGEAMNQSLGRLVGVGIGAGLGVAAGFLVKVDDGAAEKHEQSSKVGRALIVGVLFAFVGAVVGALWSQFGPVGGAAQYGEPGSGVRTNILPGYLAAGGLLGAIIGAALGVLSVRKA